MSFASNAIGLLLERRHEVGPDYAVDSGPAWCERNGNEPGGDSGFGAKLMAVNPGIEGVRLAESG